MSTDGIVIDVAVGVVVLCKPLLNEKKQARVHDRIMELLVDVQHRVFATMNPTRSLSYSSSARERRRQSGIKAV